MSTFPGKLPTMADVAREAGVSLPTVSRVFTGSAPVREATHVRIMEAVKTLRYRPNSAARALVRGQPPMVGVVTTDTAVHGYSGVLVDVERRARQEGYVTAVVAVDSSDPAGGAEAVEALLDQPLAGVVILEHAIYESAHLAAVLEGVPVVTVMHGPETDSEVPHVHLDDRQAAIDVTRHLLSLGHRTVHHVAAPAQDGEPHNRELAWRETLEGAGLVVPEVYRTDWSIAAARDAGREIARNSEVTAVFCASDQIAFGVMRSLADEGKRIPLDVSVAGIDDLPFSELSIPSLTTYHIDLSGASIAALEQLLDLPPSPDGASMAQSPLRLRESTAPPAA